MVFNITSTAFDYGAMIPVANTCDGDDVSPPLRWEEVPGATTSFALIMEEAEYMGRYKEKVC